MADHKKTIIKFKKTASTEEKQRTIDDLRAKGAEIYNDDSVNSKIMPFVVLALPEDHFHALHSAASGGSHPAVDLVEEDQEVRIQ
ncbi:hypothetical protein Q5752_001458 [Cryptotrichosporon argae]